MKNAPTQSDTRPARTLDGYHRTQSRIPRPSVAREYTPHRSGAPESVLGQHPGSQPAGPVRGVIFTTLKSGGCKAVVGPHVTRTQGTYPYPGLELITPAGDSAHQASCSLCFTDSFREQGGSWRPDSQANQGRLNQCELTSGLKGNAPVAPSLVELVDVGWLEGQKANSGGRFSRAVRLRSRATCLSRLVPSSPSSAAFALVSGSVGTAGGGE